MSRFCYLTLGRKPVKRCAEMDVTNPSLNDYPSLLEANDPPVFEVLNRQGKAPVFLLCCHAGRDIPRELGDLGLNEHDQTRHISWDIGAGDVTREVSNLLDAPALLANYSRLVIDLNRLPGAFDSIPGFSDKTRVPGNCALNNGERTRRLDGIFWPYHNAVADAYTGHCEKVADAALVTIHSFTPRLNGGTLRHWEAGILWNRDARLAGPMIEYLRDKAGICVGDNEPYSGRKHGFSLNYHAGDAGRPHLAIEIRQDLIDTPDGVARWSKLLADTLTEVLRADVR